MSDTIDIKGLDKAELLAALVNGTRPLGLGALQARGEMTKERAQERINERQSHDNPGVSRLQMAGRRARYSLYFDYVEGRPIKCDIGGDTADPWGYDRNAGQGAFARVVASLRGSK